MEDAIKKVRARGAIRKEGMSLSDLMDYKEPVAAGSRKCVRKYRPLALTEKMQMLHKVIVQNESQKDVAKEYRIKEPVLSKLKCKVMR